MAKAYKHLRRQRTERRLKNQSFMEPSKRPLAGEAEEILYPIPFQQGCKRNLVKIETDVVLMLVLPTGGSAPTSTKPFHTGGYPIRLSGLS